jgi:serine/threonine-protein kinase
MPLAPGSIFGHYEILAAVGAGGMGRVFRARDLDLNRDVALKLLLPEVSGDADRLARLIREAQVLASLNHPNIAGIYALEHDKGLHALVMEFVEGPTLADRIALGAVPVDEALPIARQIADALCAAHEQGVIHRDLKPANVKIRLDGTVKVLDFGLAKALDPRLSDDPTKSPTLSLHTTGSGAILGTAAFMSPEQAAGRAVDRRTDLWSFGVVIMEMLTGKPVFSGETVSHVLAAVLKTEPDFSTLPADTPAPLRRLLRRCLQKDPRQRLADAGDARLEIDDAMAPGEEQPAPSRTRPLQWVPWAIVAALVVALAVVIAQWRANGNPVVPANRLEARLGGDAPMSQTTFGSSVALSPDGSAIVFVAEPNPGERHLYARELSELNAHVIAGTEGADSPFFSPDGRWVAFFADGRLKKVALAGGAAVTLCDAPNGRGGDWGDDQQIVFQPDATGPLMRVSAGGGTPAPLTTLQNGEVTHRWPQFVDSGRAVLFTSNNSRSNWESASIVLQSFRTGTRTVVHHGGYYGRYVPTGHVLYLQQGLVFAKTLDIDRPDANGSPLPVVDVVLGGTGSGAAHLAVSREGTMVYAPRPRSEGPLPMVWMDRTGRISPLLPTPVNWRSPQISTDGAKLAVAMSDGQQSDVWAGPWAKEDGLARLTFDAADDLKPVWSPDGRAIVFGSTRAGPLNLYVQPTDGGAAQRLTDTPNAQAAGSWHPGGKFLAYQENRPKTGQDLMVAAIAGDSGATWSLRDPTVFVGTTFSEVEPMFSPDGQWIAYVSNSSGRDEVYVRPFPQASGVWQVSVGGGTTPTWSRQSPELLYRALSGELMTVGYVATNNSFRPDTPRLWSQVPVPPRQGLRPFDLHPDGQRVAIGSPERVDDRGRDHVTIVFNFFQRLRQLSVTN